MLGPGSIDVDLTTTADCFFLYKGDGRKTFAAAAAGDLCTSSWNSEVGLGCLHEEKAHIVDDDVMKSLWTYTPPFIPETSALLLLLLLLA